MVGLVRDSDRDADLGMGRRLEFQLAKPRAEPPHGEDLDLEAVGDEVGKFQVEANRPPLRPDGLIRFGHHPPEGVHGTRIDGAQGYRSEELVGKGSHVQGDIQRVVRQEEILRELKVGELGPGLDADHLGVPFCDAPRTVQKPEVQEVPARSQGYLNGTG